MENLACAITIVLNLSQESWNKLDEANLQSAKTRCEQVYGASAPCLIRFTKTATLTYKAICGEKQ